MSVLDSHTVASIIGEPDDEGYEAACKEFRSQVGRMQQEDAQTDLTITEHARRDWFAAQRIVDRYKSSSVTGEAIIRNLMSNKGDE